MEVAMDFSRPIIHALLVVLSFVPGVVQAETSCAALETRWGQGPTRAVAYSAGTVYYGVGTQMVAVSSATDAELGRLDVGGVVVAIEVFGDHAFIAGSKSGLIVVDISDLSSMQVVAQTDEPTHANGVAANSDIAVVTDFWDGVWVFDISSPASTQWLATVDVDGLAQDVVLSGHHAVIAEGTTGIRVLDLSDPANPTQEALLVTGGEVNGLTIDGSTLFVADHDVGLITVDLSNPASPAVLGSLPLQGSVAAIAVTGTTAWVAADYRGFFAVDISDLENLVELGSGNLSRGTEVHVAAAGTQVWFATWTDGMARVDGADPTNPQEAAWFAGAGEMRSVEALGEYAVVADWSGLQLRVLDLSPSAGPEQIGSLQMTGFPRRMKIASNRAYVAMEWDGFAIVDLSDPTIPVLLGSVAIPGHPQDVALVGDVALVAAKDGGLHIVDITHPEAPSITATVDISGNAMGVSVVGTIAYVAAQSSGLVVVDVATPANPQVLATLDLNGKLAVHTAPFGDYVFVSAYYSGFFIVDVSDPANPVIVTHTDYNGTTRSAVIDGNLAFVGDSRNGLMVVDLSDPTSPVILGSTPTPGDSWYGAFVGDDFVLADDQAGVAVFDVSACGGGSSAPHADFTYAPQNPRAGDTVTFSDLSTGNPTSWQWRFMDDGSTSSEKNPSHVFALAGGHEVRLEVSNQAGSSNASRTIVVEPAEGELPPVSYPFAATAVIPAAAHKAGAQGTAWITDVVLHNPQGDDVTAFVFLQKSGVNSSLAEAVEFVVGSNESVLLADVVLQTFGKSSATGAILIGSDQSLVISSRTYNTAAEGTYGQYIPGLDVNQALTAGQSTTLIQLSEGTSFRTNLGVANASAVNLEVAAEIYSGNGQALGTRLFDVPPWSHQQVNEVFTWAGFPEMADGYAVIRCDTVGARWFAYASVVDNRSGDPVYIAPTLESSEPLWIAAASHVRGTNNTNWRTDIELFSTAKSLSGLSVQWLESSGGTPQEVDLDFTGTPCQRIEDVLDALFGGNNSGALRLEAEGGTLAVTSRTYNDPGDATYGQYIPAVVESGALVWGESARLVQLAHSPKSNKGFRSNLGFVNTTGQTLTMYVELRDGGGSTLGTLNFDLAPWQYHQLNNVYDDVTEETLDNAYAVVTTWTGGAAYFAFASVVDNRSGDPVFIPAVRDP